MAQQFFRQSFHRVLTRTPLSCHTTRSESHHSVLCCGAPWQQQHAFMSTWEKDRKSGYRKDNNNNNNNSVQRMKRIRYEAKMLGSNMNMLHEELQQKLSVDLNKLSQQTDTECVWNFSEQEKVDAWTLTTDSDHNEGHSRAKFAFSKNKTGLFHGHLSTQVPKDGVTRRAGYCNICSPTKHLSFNREDVHDWSSFTHLVLRVRGDGRSYMLTLSVDHHFDVLWHDQHHYILYTHGGPYWQTAKIPFSKFYATSKGRILDKQSPVQLEKVTHLGISLGDDNEGPFSLEIDAISVMYDENHDEQFAYE